MSRARSVSRLGIETGITISSSGNVGFGSLSPSVKVDVIGGLNVSSNSNFLSNINIAGIATANAIGIATNSTTQPFQVGSGSTIVLVDNQGDLGIGTATVPTRLYVQGTSASNIVGLGTTNAATTLNFAAGNNFSLTLVGNITLSNPVGLTTGQSGIILIQQDSGGSRTVGFGSFWDFPSATAPTLSTGANALDCLTYFVRNSTSIITNSLIGIGTL